MTEKLEHLFLHFCTTGEDKDELAGELKAEIERLTNVIGELSMRVSDIQYRRHPSRLIQACDEAISQALRASESDDYATAFACLQQARNAIPNIRSAQAANLAYEAARAAYEALITLCPSSRLKTLLTLQNLAALLDETDELLQCSKYRQGEMLGRACRRRSETLSEQQEIIPEILPARLNWFLNLCDELAGFISSEREDWADKTALHEVGQLLQARHCALAERLLEDLEVELTPHRTFLALYRELQASTAQPPAAPLVSDDELRELIKRESWSAATSLLLRNALDRLSDQLAAAPARAASLQQQVAVYQA